MLVEAGQERNHRDPDERLRNSTISSKSQPMRTPRKNKRHVFRLLAIAKPTDGANFDATITTFATTSTQLLPEVRAAMIHEVLEKRMNAASVPALVDFARSTKDIGSATAALTAVRKSAGDAQFDPFFSIVQGHPNAELRKAAEEAITEILRKTSKRGEYAKLINSALKSTTDSKIREGLQTPENRSRRLSDRSGRIHHHRPHSGPLHAPEFLHDFFQDSRRRHRLVHGVEPGKTEAQTAFRPRFGNSHRQLHVRRLLLAGHAGGPGGTGHPGVVQQDQQSRRIALVERKMARIRQAVIGVAIDRNP